MDMEGGEREETHKGRAEQKEGNREKWGIHIGGAARLTNPSRRSKKPDPATKGPQLQTKGKVEERGGEREESRNCRLVDRRGAGKRVRSRKSLNQTRKHMSSKSPPKATPKSWSTWGPRTREKRKKGRGKGQKEIHRQGRKVIREIKYEREPKTLAAEERLFLTTAWWVEQRKTRL